MRGVSVANANAFLTTLAGVCLFAELHIGDPGAAGLANLSSVTTRISVTWPAPAGGSMTASNTPSWGNWAGTNGEVITDIALWTLASAGVFEDSIQLVTPVTATTGLPVALYSLILAWPASFVAA